MSGLPAEAIGPLGPVGRGLLGGALGLGAIVAIDVAGGDQSLGRPPVVLGSLRLVIGAVRPADLRPFVPVDADPAEAVEDSPDGVLDVPLLVGVVDPEDELAAVMAGQQPVEQGRPHPADVQETGRAGGEPRAETGLNAWRHHRGSFDGSTAFGGSTPLGIKRG